MSKGEKKIYLIDHTHVFNLETLWDKYQLRQCMEREDYKDILIMESNQYLYDILLEAQKVDIEVFLSISGEYKSILSKNAFDEIVSDIPEEWEATMEELSILAEYLNYRFDNLDNMCYIIDKYLKRR